jgi:putative transposase
VLRDCARRGMHAPVLAVGDGALGFWGALREVFPRTRLQLLLVPQDRQRPCRAAEVAASGGEKALAEIWNAEDRRHALDA